MQEKCFRSSRSSDTFIRLPQDIFLKTYLIYKSDNQRQVYVKYSFDTGTRGKQKTERRTYGRSGQWSLCT